MGDLFHSTPKPPTQNKVFMVVDYTEAQVTGIIDEMKKEVMDADKEWAEWFQKRANDKAEYRTLKEEEKGKSRKSATLQWKAEQEEAMSEKHKFKSRLTVRGTLEEAATAAGSTMPPAEKRQRTELPATTNSVRSDDAMRGNVGTAQSSTHAPSMDLAGYASDGSTSDDSSSDGPFRKRRSTPTVPISEEQIALDSQNAAIQKMLAAAAEAYRNAQSDNSSEENDSVALDGTHLFSSRPAPVEERPPEVMTIGTAPKAKAYVPPEQLWKAGGPPRVVAPETPRIPTVVAPPAVPKRGVAALLAQSVGTILGQGKTVNTQVPSSTGKANS